MFDFKELNNLPMLDVVEKLEHKVKTSGRNKVMLCPFHEDHHPSMVVYEHFAKCYACGKGLGVINFVMEAENKDLKEACEWLYEQFSPPLTPPRGRTPSGTCERKTKKPTLHSLQNIVDKATNCISHPSPNHGANEASEERLNVSLCRSEGRTSICSTEGKEGMGVRGSDGSSSYVFDLSYVAKHLGGNDSFCKCLRTVFDAELVDYVIDMYGIGCWAVDDTMFPIIDKDLRVHNIKIQHYDTNPLSEHFFHKDRGAAWWYAKRYIETHKDVKGTLHDVNCYFGEHLISKHPLKYTL